jgi:hypothetical protein
MIENSVTSDLKRELESVMLASGFEGSEKGGVTFLLCLLTTLFASPQSKQDALRAELVKFGNEGYKKISGENVATKNKHIRNVLTVLKQCNGGTPDFVTIVVKGLLQCSVKAFSEHFAFVQRTMLREKLNVERSLRTRNATSPLDQEAIFSTIFDLLTTADSLYESLCIANEWVNTAGKDVRAFTFTPGVRVVVCWNCGKPHHLKDCTEPRNEKRIKENYLKHKEEKKDTKDPQKAAADKKSVPKSEIPSRDSTGNVKEPKFNPSTRKYEVHCKKCEAYTNHSTRFHGQALKNGAAFNLALESPTHPAVVAQQKFDANEPAPAVTPSTPAATGAGGPRATTADIRHYNINMKQLIEQVQRGGNDQFTRNALEALAAKQQEFAQNFV